MTVTEVKRLLIEVRVIQQEYNLLREKAAQYDTMIGGAGSLSHDYHDRLSILEKAMTESRRITDILRDCLDTQVTRIHGKALADIARKICP